MRTRLFTVFLAPILFVFGCANVSVRNYKPSDLKPNERTIVGSFEVINDSFDGRVMSDCKITFLLPNGKDSRRYFAQKEDQGIVLTWSETGTVKLQGVDCGDGSYGVKLLDQGYSFTVSESGSATYFGHVQIRGKFTGMSDTAGAGALGAVGIALAGASRTNELKTITISDHWKATEPTLKSLAPSIASENVKKSLFSAAVSKSHQKSSKR